MIHVGGEQRGGYDEPTKNIGTFGNNCIFNKETLLKIKRFPNNLEEQLYKEKTLYKKNTLFNLSDKELLTNKWSSYNTTLLYSSKYDESEFTVKFINDFLEFSDLKQEKQYKNYSTYTEELLKIIYNRYDKKYNLYYLFMKDKTSLLSPDFIQKSSSRSKKASIYNEEYTEKKLFIYFRKFQLIIIKSINDKIISLYDEYIEKKTRIEELIIKNAFEEIYKYEKKIFDIWLQIKYQKYVDDIFPIENRFKYIYAMFEKYIIEIYCKMIIKNFNDINYNQEFNRFSVEYLIKYLLLKNEIFYDDLLSIDMFDVSNITQEELTKYTKYIDEINSIFNNIKEFLGNLKNNIETKKLGSKLLNINEKDYDEEIKKIHFIANSYIDFSVNYILDPKAKKAIEDKAAEEKAKVKAAEEKAKVKAASEEAKEVKAASEEAKVKAASEEAKVKAAIEEAKIKVAEEAKIKAAEEAEAINKYENTNIINSPANVLEKHNIFCPIITKKLEPYIDEEKITKLFGINKFNDEFRLTCTSKYEFSDYLLTNSPLSAFLLFYWSDFVNTMLTNISLSTKNAFFIDDKDIYSYDMQNRFVKQEDSIPIPELMKNNVYLGYIKVPMNDGSAILFIFIDKFAIKLYNIYGIKIPFGNITRAFKITNEEIWKSRGNFKFYPIITEKEKNNKTYWLMWNGTKEDYYKLKQISLPEPAENFKENIVKMQQQHQHSLEKISKIAKPDISQIKTPIGSSELSNWRSTLKQDDTSFISNSKSPQQPQVSLPDKKTSTGSESSNWRSTKQQLPDNPPSKKESISAVREKTPVISQVKTPVISQVKTPVISQIKPPVISQTTTPNISKLTTPDISKITTPDISKITTPDISKTTTPNISKLTTPDISKITTPDISKITTPDISKITTPDISKITTPDISKITTPDISKITTPNISAVKASYISKVKTHDNSEVKTSNTVKQNDNDDSDWTTVTKRRKKN